MSMDDFLLYVFCLVDDEVQALFREGRLRQRGPAPTLADSEVITIELVGEFLGLDRDKAAFAHFRRYHLDAFPRLAQITRTTFARQAANLWWVKRSLQEHLAKRLTAGDPRWLVDSVPVYACQFRRGGFCRRFAGEAAFGKDFVAQQTFYGFRLHLRVSPEGIIEALELAAANVAEIHLVAELSPPPGSVGLGDRNYWNPRAWEELAAEGVRLLAPFRMKSKDPDPVRSRRLNRKRWMIETVIGQLAERLHVKRTWARDLWHLCHRILRKVLCHTVAAYLNVLLGRPPLEFDGLLEE